MNDNRGSFRYRTHREGKILLGKGNTINCIVRDISTKGAGLELATAATIPDEFILYIPQQNQRFHCRVVWRKENKIGVQYF